MWIVKFGMEFMSSKMEGAIAWNTITTREMQAFWGLA